MNDVTRGINLQIAESRLAGARRFVREDRLLKILHAI